MLDKLIQDMKEKGLISVAPLNLRGKAKPVLDFWAILADTAPFGDFANRSTLTAIEAVGLIAEYYSKRFPNQDVRTLIKRLVDMDVSGLVKDAYNRGANNPIRSEN